jgi:hypothetical protein
MAWRRRLSSEWRRGDIIRKKNSFPQKLEKLRKEERCDRKSDGK